MTIKNWITGARVRTLPLAVAPIVLGSASADLVDRFDPLLATLALLVALLLQIGVNYANDYSDGIRGTDEDRVGPLRLVGSGAANSDTGPAGSASSGATTMSKRPSLCRARRRRA